MLEGIPIPGNANKYVKTLRRDNRKDLIADNALVCIGTINFSMYLTLMRKIFQNFYRARKFFYYISLENEDKRTSATLTSVLILISPLLIKTEI